MGTSLVFGSAVGPLAAAQLVDVLGYRGLFGDLAVVGGISTLTLMAFVPETLPPSGASCRRRGRCNLRQSTRRASAETLLMTTDSLSLVTTAIFALTYLALAFGRIPGLRSDRAGIALIGAAAMLAVGVLDLHEAARAVDYETIVLLFGMMVVVAYLKLAGFFALATDLLAEHCQRSEDAAGRDRRPGGIPVGLSGQRRGVRGDDAAGGRPLPAAPAATHTLSGRTGDGVERRFGGDHHGQPPEHDHRVAVGHLLPAVISTGFFHRAGGIDARLRDRGLGLSPSARRYSERDTLGVPETPPRTPTAPRQGAATVTLGTVLLFFAGQPIALVALAAAGLLMLDRTRPEKVYRIVDWPLLVMFCGLFVVVHAFEVNVVHAWGLDRWQGIEQSPVVMVSGLSVALSNLVSNVPAVLLFKPLIDHVPQAEQAWLALAMSSTLAGNLTLLGSVANLIVVESARRSAADVSFFEYLKVGVPLTLLTTATGIAWLATSELLKRRNQGETTTTPRHKEVCPGE